MESVGSNSPPRSNHRTPLRQSISDRILRAHRHHLRLLDRSNPFTFFVLGATGNVYTVTLTATPTCTCPDRITPCKHILFVLIRALGVSLDDTCLRRSTLRPCHLRLLLASPTRPDSFASPVFRQRFQQLQARSGTSTTKSVLIKNVDDKVMSCSCPVCLEDIIVEKESDSLVACRVCKNILHEECMVRWRRSRGRRSTNCVICRARWRDNHSRVKVSGDCIYSYHEDEYKYINLGAYVNEDVVVVVGNLDNEGEQCGGS